MSFRVGDAQFGQWRRFVGRPITFQYRGDMAFIGEVCGYPAEETDWNTWAFWKDDRQVYWEWTTQVTDMDGDIVHLAKPLRLPIRQSWQVTCGERHGNVSGVVLEDFRVEMPVHKDRGHLNDAGYNAVFVCCGYGCLLRGLTVAQADNGVILEKTCSSTISDLVLEGGNMHHGTSFRNGAHDNVLARFVFKPAYMTHGISSQDLASGNVWAEGVMETGTFDSHGGMPFDSIRTGIALRPAGWPGGTRDSGPKQGRRMVNWNISVLPRKKMKPASLMMIAGEKYFPNGTIAGIHSEKSVFAELTSIHAKQSWANYSNFVVQTTGWGRGVLPENLYEAQRRLTGR
jgi:hypothetical protein